VARSVIHRPVQKSEPALLAYIKNLRARKVEGHAVLIRLSRLAPAARISAHGAEALKGIGDLVRRLGLGRFDTPSGDLLIAFAGDYGDEMRAILIKMRFLMVDGPTGARGKNQAAQGLIQWYSLDKDYDVVAALTQNQPAIADEPAEEVDRSLAEQAETLPAGGARYSSAVPLTPKVLARLQTALATVDPSGLMRRQTVCALVGKSKPLPLFQEMFLSIDELQDMVMPNVALGSSPWLFQELRDTLDRRVLSVLARRDNGPIDRDISLNLNVQTLLSDDFIGFDETLTGRERERIIIELQKLDILADLGLYEFVRDFALERGYRICIDGVTLDGLFYIDRARLGADLLKLVWDPAMGNSDNGSLADYVRDCGEFDIILCRCDSEDSIRVGHAIGVSMFQGRHVERLLSYPPP